jgi:proteasome beta subunit
MDRDAVIRVAVESLYDAADDDSATGGPDITRGIYPIVMLATAEGTTRVDDVQLGAVVRQILAEREARPGA